MNTEPPLDRERRKQFVSQAVIARQHTVQGGQGYSAEDVHDYLRQKTQGKPAPCPTAVAWQRQKD